MQRQSNDSIVAIVGQTYDVYYAMENHHEHALIQEATKEYQQFRKVLPGLRVRGFVYNGRSLRGLKYCTLGDTIKRDALPFSPGEKEVMV